MPTICFESNCGTILTQYCGAAPRGDLNFYKNICECKLVKIMAVSPCRPLNPKMHPSRL